MWIKMCLIESRYGEHERWIVISLIVLKAIYLFEGLIVGYMIDLRICEVSDMWITIDLIKSRLMRCLSGGD